MKKIGVLFSLLLVTILITSCNETKKVIDTAGTAQLSGSYTITGVYGATVNSKSSLTLQFTAINKTISGASGCNQFSGNYSIDLFAINIGQLMATEMYCDEPVMETERAYLKAISNTGSYSIVEEVLTFYSKTDRSQLLTAKKNKN
ncbi:META domain-containing protein [Patiriisocius sp. Uisw_017]|jgi:heat shock protein HslJ|uniref:META domain-containing protein n=1 Tax=Patiriisocius sp. Uisw_017 TaxID=3230968 RepID=UPI0039EC7BF2